MNQKPHLSDISEGEPHLVVSIPMCQCALPASSIERIFYLPSVTPPSAAIPSLVGTIAIEQNIVSLYDLARFLGFENNTTYNAESVVILCCNGNTLFAFVVYDVNGLIDINLDEQDTESPVLHGQLLSTKKLLIDGDITLVLDLSTFAAPTTLDYTNE